MKTLTLKLSDAEAAKLDLISSRKRIPKSRYVRKLINTALKNERDEPSLYDLMKDAVGCFDSGVTDLATNPKHLKGLGKWRS